MGLEDMTLINYVLVFTNNKGKLALSKNNGTEATFESKPFYKSEKNAEEGIKKIMRSIKASNKQSRKHWYDKTINSKDKHSMQGQRFINDYENGMLILKNGLTVKKVLIKVELD